MKRIKHKQKKIKKNSPEINKQIKKDTYLINEKTEDSLLEFEFNEFIHEECLFYSENSISFEIIYYFYFYLLK